MLKQRSYFIFRDQFGNLSQVPRNLNSGAVDRIHLELGLPVVELLKGYVAVGVGSHVG